MEKTEDQNERVGLVGLDAVAAFLFGFSSLGGGRNSVRAGIYRARGIAGIRRSLQRSGPPIAADLFLSAAPAPSIRAVECVVDRTRVRRAEKKQRRLD